MAKGAAYTMFELVRYSLMTAIVVIAIVTFLSAYVRIMTDTRPTEAAIYSRMLARADALHEGVLLVPERLTDETLDGILAHPDNRFVGAKVTLTDSVSGEVREAYWNRRWYDIYKPVTSTPGPGSAIDVATTWNVLVATPQGAHPGLLNIDVVTPAR